MRQTKAMAQAEATQLRLQLNTRHEHLLRDIGVLKTENAQLRKLLAEAYADLKAYDAKLFAAHAQRSKLQQINRNMLKAQMHQASA